MNEHLAEVEHVPMAAFLLARELHDCLQRLLMLNHDIVDVDVNRPMVAERVFVFLEGHTRIAVVVIILL